MGNKLNAEDIKSLQLEMLIEIDSFCRSHDIKYSISCGTLIGAIRHKGFIPWDDDVDITMPYADMIKFKELFKSDNMYFCDLDVLPYYEWGFPQIVSKKTYSTYGKRHMGYGISIDLYPIVECSSDRNVIESCLVEAKKVRKKMFYIRRMRRFLLKTFPIKEIKFPFFTKMLRADRDSVMKLRIQNQDGCSYYQIGGPLKIFYKNFWNFNPLEELIEVEFEGHNFYAPLRYHEFLTVRYGDYMKLPPEEQRHPYHGGTYYWL